MLESFEDDARGNQLFGHMEKITATLKLVHSDFRQGNMIDILKRRLDDVRREGIG